MAKKIKRLLGEMSHINCACVIHDTKYDFHYVDRLYRALCRNLTPEVILHVYTESNRDIPDTYIKHDLQEWPGIRGPKKSWWYKIQLFNSKYYSGQMLYFDLDTVIVDNIDWIWKLPKNKFWAVKDFKYLFRNRRITMNSSIMWFDTREYNYIYENFDYGAIRKNTIRYHGDQDYINAQIPHNKLEFFDSTKIVSYKWQIKEGGYNFSARKYNNPGEISYPSVDADVLVFHGSPNPGEEDHPIVRDNWY